MGNGKKVCLRDLANKAYKIIFIKESFVMGRKMGKGKFYTETVVIMKATLLRILYKEKVNIIIKIIIGKEIGKMDICKAKANK
jgi:hypothetical protein